MGDFGKRLKELREAARLSQEELADQVGISKRSIQRYEKKTRPDAYNLVELATYFNISMEYLLGLKSEIELVQERNEKLKGKGGYIELYPYYIKCLNNYEIVKGAEYYWIELEGNHSGGQTKWVGWADKEHTKEIRRLRPVEPKEAIEMCTLIKGRPLVLNSLLDAIVFLNYGGQAIVRKDICEKYLPGFLEDYIAPNQDMIIGNVINFLNGCIPAPDMPATDN